MNEMNKTKCEFCEALKSYKQIHDFSNSEYKRRGVECFYHEYTVAMIIRTWTKSKGKRKAGRTTDYRYRGIGYKLNYCPECGERLG